MENSRSKKRIITGILTVLAMLIVLSGINVTVMPPLPNYELFKPTYVACCDDGYVITAENNVLLLFTDNSLTVRNAVSTDKNGSPFEIVTDAEARGSRVFITGADREYDGIYYKSETVAEYSSDGRFVSVLYTESYPEDEYYTSPNFLDVKVTDGGRVLLLVSRRDRVELLDITEGGAKTVLCAATPFKVNGGEIYGDRGGAYIWECVGRYYVLSEEGEISRISNEEFADAFCDRFGIRDDKDNIVLYAGQPEMGSLSLKTGDAGEPEYLLYSTYVNLHRYSFADKTDEAFDGLKISFRLFAFSVMFCSAVLFLAVIAVIKIIALVKDEKTGPKARPVLVIIIISALISSFYTDRVYRLVEDNYGSRLLAQNAQFHQILQQQYDDVIGDVHSIGALEYISDDGKYERFLEFKNAVTGFVNANGKEDCFYARVEIADSEWSNYLLSTEDPKANGNFDVKTDVAVDYFENLHKGIFRLIDDGDDYICCMQLLYDEQGNTIGCHSIGFNASHMTAVKRQNGLNMLVSLIVLMIIVYVVFKAASAFKTDIGIFRASKAEGKASRLTLLCGPAAFLVSAVSLIDSVVLVYAAKSICAGLPDAAASKLAALPVALFSFGIMSGSALPSLISGKIKENISCALFCLSGALAMACAVYALKAGSIYLFSAAKFIEGTGVCGAAYSVIFAAPFNCADAEERRRLINSSQTAAVTAGVLGVFAGGYISEYLDYQAIFTAKGVISVLLAAVCFFMLSGSQSAVREEPVKKNRKAWGFYLKPEVLAFYLCCILPMNLFNGYRAYLFPIYSGSAGISAAMLSNIYVIARAGAFLSADAMTALSTRYPPGRIVKASLITCSACFICFILCPNIWWAVAVLFISNILIRSTNTASIYCRSEFCEALGYDTKEVSLCSETVNGVFGTVTSPVLSLFLAFGNNLACSFLGGVCLLLTGGYSLLQRRKKPRGADARHPQPGNT